MNSFQKLSKTGKPMINKHNNLPIYVKSVDSRINLIKTQLGIEKESQFHLELVKQDLYEIEESLKHIKEELNDLDNYLKS